MPSKLFESEEREIRMNEYMVGLRTSEGERRGGGDLRLQKVYRASEAEHVTSKRIPRLPCIMSFTAIKSKL